MTPPDPPDRDGYTFLYWKTTWGQINSDGSGGGFCPDYVSYNNESSIVAYGVWKQLHKITYYLEQGSDQIVYSGYASDWYTFSESEGGLKSAPSRDGYTFLYWDSPWGHVQGGDTLTEMEYVDKTESGDVVLYGVWQSDQAEVTQHTVRYELNGGTWSVGTESTVEGDSYTIPLEIPLRSGYTFKNWGFGGEEFVPG